MSSFFGLSCPANSRTWRQILFSEITLGIDQLQENALTDHVFRYLSPLNFSIFRHARIIALLLALVLTAGLAGPSDALTSTDVIGMTELGRLFPGFAGALAVLLDFNANPDATSRGSYWPYTFDTTDLMSTDYQSCTWYGICSNNGSAINFIQIDVLWARAVLAPSISPANLSSLASFVDLTNITIVIPDDEADEAILAPFIASLLSALPVDQIISIIVSGTPRVLTVGEVDVFESLWSWTHLLDLEIDVVPTIVPVAATHLVTFSARYSSHTIIPISSRTTLTSLSLLDQATGYTGPAGDSFRTNFPSLQELILTLPSLTSGWNLQGTNGIKRLTLIGTNAYVTWDGISTSNGSTFECSPLIHFRISLTLACFSTFIWCINIDSLRCASEIGSSKAIGGSINLSNIGTLERLNVEDLTPNSMNAFTFTAISTPTTFYFVNVSHSVVERFFDHDFDLASVILRVLQISLSDGSAIDPVSDLRLNATAAWSNSLWSLTAPFNFNSPSLTSSSYSQVFPLSILDFTSLYTSVASSFDWTQLGATFPILRSLDLAESAMAKTAHHDPSAVSNALKNITSFGYLTLRGGSLGGLEGTLPSQFFADIHCTSITISGHSLLTGTIPTTGIGLLSLNLDLSNNDFVAIDPFQFQGNEATNLYTLDFSNNRITTFPSEDDIGQMDYLQYINFNNNPLSGPIPTSWFANRFCFVTITFLAANTSLSGSVPTLAGCITTLDLSHTLVSGPLPTFDWDSFASRSRIYNFSFQGNLMNGSIPNRWKTQVFSKLDLSNTAIATEALNLPLMMSPLINIYLDISNITFEGRIWHLANLRGGVLKMDDLPFTNFCPSSENLPSYYVPPSYCSMDRTLIDTQSNNTECLEAWMALGCLPVPSAPVPFEPVPVAPVPVLSPSQCAQPAPSSTAFFCEGGQWRTASSVSVTQLTIPPNAGTLIIGGNLAVGNVSFSGLGSSLIVEGCVTYLPIVTVTLTEEDVKALQNSNGKRQTVTLVSLAASSTCPHSAIFESTNLIVTSKGTSSCKKVSVQKTNGTTSSASLTALFKLDDSKCSLWWIVLVSVIFSVIFVVILVILAAKFVPACQVMIRPFKGTDARL